ncbi:MAG: hypothetical protein GX121_06940, partial [Ignavibacteria bacterium]|nr:hypothetical protein [Ignavibacteria bacterium]
NYSSGIPSTVPFEWEFGVAVETYQLQVATDADFSQVVYDDYLTVSEVVVGLAMNSEYYWRVKAYNPSSESDWSEVWQFTTGSYFTIGEGTEYNTNTVYPAPYGNWYYGAKHQMLILADEIYDAGGMPGAFTSLSFNIFELATGRLYNNFQIRMKPTMATVLDATWDVDDFTDVYFNPSLPTNDIGWFTHMFEEPFVWDGTSNILVDVCFNNSSIGYNHSTYWTQTPFNSVRYYRADNATVCTAFGTATLSNLRPNIMFSVDASGILPPLNIYPTNGELGVSQTPLFDWGDVDGAISYGLLVATDPSFENIVIFEEGLDESQYQVPEGSDLSPSTMHYWRANASDGYDLSPWSARWSFATGGDLPAPILISPPNYSAGIPSTVQFMWEFGIAVETYQLQVAIDADFNTVIYDEMLSVSEVVVGLAMNSEYYWRVKAFNPSSESEWSDVWEFTTGSFFEIGQATTSSSGYPAPYGNLYWGAKHQLLVLSEEIYDAGGIPGAITSLSFNIDVLNNSNPLNNFTIKMKPTMLTSLNDTWDLEEFQTVYVSPSFVNVAGWNTHLFDEPYIWDGSSNILIDVCFQNTDWQGNQTMFYTTTNYNSVRYYYGDNATVCTNPDYCYTSTQRSNMMFSIDASGLFPPLNIYPTNGELGVSQTPLFDWEDVEDAISYGLIVALDPNFENIVISEEGLDASQYQVPEGGDLAPSTLHYWRANASDGYETSPWSMRWSFATGGPLPPPTLIFPFDYMSGIPATVPFEWEFGVAVETYQLQVAADEEFNNVVYDQILTVSQITVGLGMNSSYYWRVKAFNPSSESDWSEVWRFTTGSFFTVGDGTEFAGNTTYPAPYGNWYGGCKHQMLIRADELYDAGAVPGVLTSLSFDVGELFGTPLQGFYIGLKNTTENTITTVWDMTDWTIVYGPTTYQPVAGWNTHIFDDGFEWDGASNILVETCFNNMSYTRSECTRYTVTPYTSVRWFNSDQNATVCTNPTSASTSPNRPNMMFGLDASGMLPPQNYQPANEALYQPLDLVFEWGEVEGAISYGLIVSTDPNFTFLVIDQTGLQETQYQVPEGTLESFQQYYWRANASDGEATSPWSQRWSFITGGELRAPYLNQPTNGASGIPSTVQFKWESIFGVGSYQLQAAIDLAFGNIVLDQVVNDNEFTFGLDMNSSYYWRVRAITPDEEGPWSEAWQFSTGSFFTIGTGTAFNGPYEYPAPYGNYWWGAKHQILIRADEMLAAGGVAGDLTSVSFNVHELNNLTVPLNGFNLKIKQTTESTLTATWDEQGLTTVFTHAALPVTLGWNTHMFNNPFEWDGVSNILLDICFNNSSYTQNAATYYTTTSYNSVREYHSDATTVCSSPSTPTLWTNRPNIMFSGGPSEPPLDPPNLISPEDGLSNRPLINQEFSWSSVEDAANYRIQVSRNTAFTNLVADQVVEETSYTLETAINPETQYWWRARAISESGLGGYWSSVWSFTTRPNLPPEFIDIITDTGNDAIIIVPTDVAPMIGSRQIANGDAIGLFYQMPTGQWRCAGYGVWDGQNIGITVWGDDDQTPEKDGYTVGEEYSFRVWDSQQDIIWTATATFSMGPSSYQVNGFSIVASLIVNVTEMFDLSVASGWNIISSFINPEDPDIENMFAPIATNIQVMRNGAGQIYNPAYNINDIGEWDIYQGYFLNMLEQDMLTISGTSIVPESTPIQLIAGWNLSPYLRNNPMNAVISLASITENLVLVKNYEGLIYAPAWGLNTIGNMLPGQGFQMNLNQASELTYPANSAGKAVAGEFITPLAKHLVPSTTRTGNSATLLVKLDAANGTEVGVYGTNGELLGSGYVQDGTVGVNIWGDNHSTELIDGAAQGELLTAKLYDPATDSYKDLLLSSIVDISKGLELDAISYSENAIYSARGHVISEDAYGFSIRNTPNPAANSTTFEFSLANDGNAEIVLYTLRGDEVARIRLDGYSAGMHTVVFNTDDLANGSYNVVLRSGTNNVSTIMMIVK